MHEVLKRKFEKSSASFGPCRIDTFCDNDHDDHQEEDAPPEGEKREKRKKTLKRLKSARGSLSKLQAQGSNIYVSEYETLELIEEFHNVDKHVLTIYDHERMKATLRDMINSWHKIFYKINHRRVRANPEEYFSDHRIVEVVRVTTEQQHGLDFMEQIIVMRENNKPYSFSEADFKYLNKNDIEDLYYLFQKKKVNYRENKLLNSLMTFIRSRVIWERVHDFQLGIESYQIRVNLTIPMLTFYGIEACDPYSIFYDATLERVLKEVKIKIFETEFLKNAPLLGDLNLDIMKAYEREINKRLRHREKMRMWESFVNGRPILSMVWP
ncbi:hypothetical protein Tco_1417709 [Tanacetum coccineum]